MARLNKATEGYNLRDIIVRANADNPIFMPNIVDIDIKRFIKSNFDVYSPFYNNKLPFGYSFVIFKKSCLVKLDKLAKNRVYREHVENYCFDNSKKFKILLSKIKSNSKFYCPSLRVTLDTAKDLKKIRIYHKAIKNIKLEYQAESLIKYYNKKWK